MTSGGITTDLVLEKGYLIGLLNRIFRQGNRKVRVSYPPYEIQLFSIGPEFQVTDVISSKLLGMARASLVDDEPMLKRELPSWGHLRDCFLSAGIVRPMRWKSLIEYLRDESEARVTKPVHLKSLYLGIDTNVAYARLYTRHFPVNNGQDLLEIENFHHVLCPMVRDEIDSRIGQRYRDSQISLMAKKLRDKVMTINLRHGNRLATRRGKLAQNEIDYLSHDLGAVTSSHPEFTGDKEESDIAIAKSYGGFAKENDVEVAVATFDQNMIDHLKNARVRPLALGYPRTLDTKSSRWWAVPALLHDLAVTFGYVRIHPFRILLSGEWQGKTTEDYEEERVRLIMEDDEPIRKEFERDVRISGDVWGILSGA
jgi:hypothetical protein